MGYRLLDRKSVTSNAGMPSRDSSIERASQLSFISEFRNKFSLLVGILVLSLLVVCTLDPGKVLEQQPSLSTHDVSHISLGMPFRSRVLHSSPIVNLIGGAGSGPERPALQGMGKLFRKGSGIMSELIVTHFLQNISSSDFRLFLRALHRSGVTARADIVLLYETLSSQMMEVIQEEEIRFQRLLVESRRVGTSADLTRSANSSLSVLSTNIGSFDLAAFWVNESSELKPISNNAKEQHARWGSMLGFDLQELDPENTLEGFLDLPSLQLRRWLCYQMLLGMVGQNYRHILLTEVEGVVFLGDPLAAVRGRKVSLYLSSEDRTWNDVEQMENEIDAWAHKSRSVLRKEQVTEIDGGGFGEEEFEYLGDARDADSYVEPYVKQERQEASVGKLTGQKKSDSKKKRRKTFQSRKKGANKGKRGGGRDQWPSGQEAKGLIEAVYGREVWDSLDKYEKSRSVVSSGVIFGTTRSIRTLTSRMATEIVRVALQRKSRQPFHDKAILNYLVYKSSVLGKTTLDHLSVVENGDSVVHCLRGSKQRNAFSRRKGPKFAVVQGYRDDILEHGIGDSIASAVERAICFPPFSAVYEDCPSSNTTGRLRGST